MSITLEKLAIGAAPALVAHPTTPGRPRTCVLYLHGLGASKGVHAVDLQRLAARGHLAIGVDAVGHGERHSAWWENRLQTPEREAALVELVQLTALEIPHWLTAVERTFGITPAHVGMLGVSFGGFITYRSVLHPVRPGALVAMIASPNLPTHTHRSPTPLRPEDFFPTPLLSITAEQDEVVSPNDAKVFHDALKTHYTAHPERLRYEALEGAVHYMGEAHWLRSQSLAADWFDRYLQPVDPSSDTSRPVS